jgi:IS30 family transposase
MMGVLMAIGGRERRLELESECWQLIMSGVGTVEACKQLGIGRKTGCRWRMENGGLPPERLAEDARSNRCLSLLERQRIATLRLDGLGVREIARRIGRSPSTVSRELQRNTLEHDHDYDGDLAHARARQRMRRPKRGRLLTDEALRAEVQAKLELEWSPEQIAAYLRRTYPDLPDWHVSHETIYQALYHGGRGGLSRELTKKLRTGRPLRRRRRRSDQRAVRFIATAELIEQRPAIVEQRVRVGDWEGDLITGRLNQSAIGTLVDRTSRYLRLVPLHVGHGAEHLRDALIAGLADLPEAARRTLRRTPRRRGTVEQPTAQMPGMANPGLSIRDLHAIMNPLICALLAFFAVQAPTAYLLSRPLGVYGIIWAVVIGWAVGLTYTLLAARRHLSRPAASRSESSLTLTR